MTREQSLSIVQSIYTAFSRADLPGILAPLDDNIDWEFIGSPTVQLTGPRRGKASVADFFTFLATSEEVKNFETYDFIADADKVAVFGREDMIIRSTGKPFKSEYAHLWWLTNGKVTKFRGFNDGFAFAAANNK